MNILEAEFVNTGDDDDVYLNRCRSNAETAITWFSYSVVHLFHFIKTKVLETLISQY